MFSVCDPSNVGNTVIIQLLLTGVCAASVCPSAATREWMWGCAVAWGGTTGQITELTKGMVHTIKLGKKRFWGEFRHLLLRTWLSIALSSLCACFGFAPSPACPSFIKQLFYLVSLTPKFFSLLFFL